MYSRAVFASSRVRDAVSFVLSLDQVRGGEALSCGWLAAAAAAAVGGRREGGVRGSESEATKRWKFGESKRLFNQGIELS